MALLIWIFSVLSICGVMLRLGSKAVQTGLSTEVVHSYHLRAKSWDLEWYHASEQL
jgi:hypothetical protein